MVPETRKFPDIKIKKDQMKILVKF